LKIRNESCAHENLKFSKLLTKNEFTERYVFAPGSFTVVGLASGNKTNRHQSNSDWVFWCRFKSRRGNIFYFFDGAKNKEKRCRNLEFCPSGSQTRSVATVTLYFTLLGGLRFINRIPDTQVNHPFENHSRMFIVT
jgi:hypothetical protein